MVPRSTLPPTTLPPTTRPATTLPATTLPPTALPVTLGNTLYIYRTMFDGNKRVQSAWGKYTFTGSPRIADIGVIDGRCYMLCENDDGFFFNSFAISTEPAAQWQTYPIRLDNRVSVKGVYAAGVTTWTLTIPDDSLTHAVMPDGTYTALTCQDSTHYTATGDWSECIATLGAAFTMSIKLSKFYKRDQDGAALLDSVVQLVKLVLNHQNSGPYSVNIVQPLSRNRTITYTPPTTTEVEGIANFYILGNNKDTDLTIQATGPKPVAITTGECAVTFNQLSR